MTINGQIEWIGKEGRKQGEGDGDVKVYMTE
jgi:hypothetical protein